MGEAVVGEGIRGGDGSNLKGRLWRCHPSWGDKSTHGTGRDVSPISNREIGIGEIKGRNGLIPRVHSDSNRGLVGNPQTRLDAAVNGLEPPDGLEIGHIPQRSKRPAYDSRG